MGGAGIALAAVAAACNAVSSVLQRKANREENVDLPFGPRFLVVLLRRPVWLLGLLAMVASFALQATALGLSSLSQVEPVLVAELPLTLLIGSWVLRRPLKTRDGTTAVGLALGLALFLVGLGAAPGQAELASRTPVLVAAGLTLVGIAAVVLGAVLGPRRWRSALLGAAAGSGFGLTAALMKVALTHLSEGGVSAVLSAWSLYGMVACGIGSVVLVQAALRSGTLVSAQPGITLLDPLVSVVWGVLVLGDRTRQGPLLALAGVGAVVMVAGVVALARSPSLADDEGAPDGVVAREPTERPVTPRRAGR